MGARRILFLILLFAAPIWALGAPSPEEGIKLRRSLAILLEKAGPDKTGAAEAKRQALGELVSLSRNFAEDPMDLLEAAGLKDITSQLEPGQANLRGILGGAYKALAESWRIPAQERKNWHDLSKAVAARVAGIPPQRLAEAMRLLPDEAFENLEPAVDAFFSSVKFSSRPAMQRLNGALKEMEFDGASRQDIELLSDTLGRYFDHLPSDRKRALALAWLRLPPNASEVSQIRAALDESGPAVQKLFQLLAGNTKDPFIKSLMTELQANVKPFPGEEALAVIERNIGRPIGEVFSELDSQSFTAGTVGQIHRGRLKSTGEEVAVKVQRPGIKERMREGFVSLKAAVGPNPNITRMLDDMLRHFEQELDLPQEAQNLDDMAIYRNPKRGLEVPRRVGGFPRMREVIVMEMAAGKALSKMKDTDPFLRAKALHAAIDQWFNEAIFGSGFFHADLHPGNLMLKAMPEGPGYRLTFVDAGSMGRLSLEERRLLVRFSVAIATRSPELSLKVLGEMAKIPPESEAALRDLVKEALSGPRPSIFHRANEIMIGAIKSGVELPANYALFSRSTELLQQQMREVNDATAKLYPHARTKSMLGMFARSVLKHAAKDIPQEFVNPTHADLATIEAKLIPEALAGAKDGIDTWFRSKEARVRALTLAQTCSAWFSLLPH